MLYLAEKWWAGSQNGTIVQNVWPIDHKLAWERGVTDLVFQTNRIYSPPFHGMFCSTNLPSAKWIEVTSKHEHWPPCIVRCLNSNCGLTITWILTMEGRFRGQWVFMLWCHADRLGFVVLMPF
jgi:hypothetical protein